MIKGRKVFLKPLEMEHIELLLKWHSDREVTLLLGFIYPPTREGEEKFIKQLQEDPRNKVFVIYIIDKKIPIGTIGLHEIEWKDRKAMLGILIGEKKYWGKGYGSDAIRTLLNFAFKEMNLNKIYLKVHDYNKRAIQCYLKCGFKEEGRLREEFFSDGKYHEVIYMGILRREFIKSFKVAKF